MQPSMVQPATRYRQAYRAPEFTIRSIDLLFELDSSSTRVTATSQVERLQGVSNSLTLDGQDVILEQIAINGQAWPHYCIVPAGLRLEQLPAAFELTIVTLIQPAQNSSLMGLYQSGSTLCTQCEAEGFRRISYFLDRPDVMACFRTKIVARITDYPILLSNGNRVGQGVLADGRHWVEWHDPFAKPCYLFALVAGDFDCLNDQFITHSGRTVSLALYVDRGNLYRADWAMACLKQAMRWEETRFGLEYDLDIYMIVAVSCFNMGAMENKGLNIFNDKYVLANPETATDEDYQQIASVIAHEYLHNWTGNRITCRDWFQLSLKEGLTLFRDQEFSADQGARAVQRIEAVRLLRSAQFAEDASPMAHPIRPEAVIEMNNFYTVTVYEKGAEVIRMLHTLLGEAGFQAGMRLYIQRHDGQAVTCDDFINAMQSAAGVDLTLFRRWYSQAGTPLLTVRDQYDALQQRYQLHVTQHTPPTVDQPHKQPLLIPLDIELYRADGTVIALQAQGTPLSPLLMLTQASQTFTFEQVPEKPIIALLKNFSAPVKLDYAYTSAQLLFLMHQARDPVARWDAAQKVIEQQVHINVQRYQQQQQLQLPSAVITAFNSLLQQSTLDPAFKAQLITLPSQRELSECFTVIDPSAIQAVHHFIQSQLAQALQAQWLSLYQAHALPCYRIDQPDRGQRALRNRCLHYLAWADQSTADQIVTQHYDQANNMTDQLAALSAALAAQLPSRQQLLDHFEQRWQQEGLVMDKWFMLQASAPDPTVLERVQALLHHPSFTLSNPNRTRALVATFCSNNPAAFHALDGRGYRFLTAILSRLNGHNPQLAAGLVEPLLRCDRYDAQRAALMRQALNELYTLPRLSCGLFEKVSKALKFTTGPLRVE